MKVYISLRGLVQVVLLLVSISFLWLTLWSYLQIDLSDLVSVMAKPVQNSVTKMLGTAFLVSFGIFAVLFFESMYRMSKQHGQKNEGVKNE
jgi:flagellar biosynthesis protein FlhB